MQARGYESQPHGLSCADGLTSTSAGKCGCRKFGHVADLRFWVMPSTDWVLVEARWPCASCNASVAHEASVGTGEPDAGQLEHRISATPGSADHETSRSQRRTEFRVPTATSPGDVFELAVSEALDQRDAGMGDHEDQQVRAPIRADADVWCGTDSRALDRREAEGLESQRQGHERCTIMW